MNNQHIIRKRKTEHWAVYYVFKNANKFIFLINSTKYSVTGIKHHKRKCIKFVEETNFEFLVVLCVFCSSSPIFIEGSDSEVNIWINT